jgi:hypothetical protein
MSHVRAGVGIALIDEEGDCRASRWSARNDLLFCAIAGSRALVPHESRHRERSAAILLFKGAGELLDSVREAAPLVQ